MNQEEQETTVKGLLNLMSKTELEMPYKSGVIIDEREQPLLLSANDDLSTFALNLGGSSIKFPPKMVPYIIEALTKMYTKNISDHFEGDATAIKEYMNDVESELGARTYFEMQDVYEQMVASGEAEHLENYDKIPLGKSQCDCGDPDCDSNDSVDGYGAPGGTSGKFGKIAKNSADKLGEDSEIVKKMIDVAKLLDDIDPKDMTEEQRLDILSQMMKARDFLKEASEEVGNRKMTEEEQIEAKLKVDEKISKHLEEVESILLGTKKEKKEEEIDFEHIKKIFQKHGPLAAKEELMRLPEEKRDELLTKLTQMLSK